MNWYLSLANSSYSVLVKFSGVGSFSATSPPTPPPSPILPPHLHILPLLGERLWTGGPLQTHCLRHPNSPHHQVVVYSPISSQVTACFLAAFSSCTAMWTSAQVGPIYSWSGAARQCPDSFSFTYSSPESIAELFVITLGTSQYTFYYLGWWWPHGL